MIKPQADPIDDAKGVIRRFNERVDAALERSLPGKDWVRHAVDRKGAERCPVSIRRFSYDLIARHGEALADLMSEYPDDIVRTQAYEYCVGYQAPEGQATIDPVDVLLQDASWTDEWGTEWEHAIGGVGASPVGHPIREWSQLDAYLRDGLPDGAARGRLDGALPAIARLAARHYFIGATHMTLFERFSFLRGMENTFVDLYESPRESERLLDALTDYFVEIIRGWARLGQVDAIFMTDDWGSQSSLLISPTMWRQFFFARYRRLFEEAHTNGLKVMFHSCGNVIDIIGDLIDAGVDILDPIQPEALDVSRVAREFGGKVAFSGGISDQLLGSNSPAQVRDEVHRMIDTLGAPFGNAYIVGPSNVLMPDVPMANIEALFEACHGA